MRVYEIVTDRITKMLEDGKIPWRQPWKGGGVPKNLKSGKPYRGINVWMLASQGYSSCYWLTYKQARDLGGYIRKGSKGTPVVFWRWLEKEEIKNGETKKKRIPLLRYYTVFSVEQCDGINAPDIDSAPLPELNPIERCEQVVANMPNSPEIRHKGNKAFYRPKDDVVNVPRMELFESVEEYYSCIYHEMSHATGNPKRLNRLGTDSIAAFGSEQYSKEELVAEFSAAYLCAATGIENVTLKNSAGYIQGWLAKIKSDKKLVVHAAAAGQKAADYILNRASSSVGEKEAS